MGDGDLKDSAVEVGMIGRGDVSQALKGQDYNNIICVHFTLTEALTPKTFDKFMDQLQRNKFYVWGNVIQNHESERMIARQTMLLSIQYLRYLKN